ncbi:MAG: glutamyl-tRNA reductase [Proteobacteria bacterium]|nr:glutamyl-tRNA reductase [Pseudomonadota bacterium]
MTFGVVGLSFRTAPLQLRERLAFAPAEIPGVLRELCAAPTVAEAMLLSTCNRVEFYLVSEDPARAEQTVRELFARQRRVTAEELDGALYYRWGGEALGHIFRVTASLDAMVVGEAQIMGQVKQAFAWARECGAVGSRLGRCMERSFAISKRVRTETEIARHPASVSSVAVDLAGRIFADLVDLTVLVVGAGEMAELAVTHLVAQGATRIRVANRSLERAQELARRLGGEAVGLETLAHQLEWADMVISSTGSPQPLIDRELLAGVMRQRRSRSLLVVDIAVPRDVDPKARSLPNLYLFDVDDLEQALAANLQARRREAKVAERIVEGELEGFDTWLRHQDVVPLIKQLRAQFSAVVSAEAQRAARQLQLEREEQRVALDRLANAIVNKLLHVPTTALKQYAAAANGVPLPTATRQLFGLPEPALGEQPEPALGEPLEPALVEAAPPAPGAGEPGEEEERK